MDWLKRVHGGEPRSAAQPAYRTGDLVRVWYKIQERDRVRLAPFEGLVLRQRGQGPSQTFTIRRVTFGEGVERVFPNDSPAIDHVEVLRRGKVKRSRLYFLRLVVGKTRIAAKDEPGAAIPTVDDKSADAATTAGAQTGSENPPA